MFKLIVVTILSLLFSLSVRGIDCNGKDLSPQEIVECNKIYDLTVAKPWSRPSPQDLSTTATISAELRARFNRIGNAVANMLDETLLVAASNNAAEPSQAQAWNKLSKALSMMVFKDYETEVHYINTRTSTKVDDDKVSVPATYELKTFTSPAIISVVIFKPKISDNKRPTAIFNHGGDPKNFVHPRQSNPQFFALAGLNYVIACPNYRGGSPEQHAQDMTAVVTYLQRLAYVDANKFILSGISAGTTLNAKILDKPVIKKMAGIFLHTGLYGQAVFEPLLKTPKDIPLFLASGALDSLVPVETTLNYIRAMQDVSKNFHHLVLDNGGHHLIAKKTADPLSETISVSETPSRKEIAQASLKVAKHFNADEVTRYISYLVEFLDRVANGDAPALHQWGSRQRPTGLAMTDLLKHVRLVRDIKKADEPTPSLLSPSTNLLATDYTFTLAQLKIILGDLYDGIPSKTIISFLQKYDGEKPAIRDEFKKSYSIDSDETWAERIQEVSANDEEIKRELARIIQKEIDYKGNYVIYHAANAHAGFLYEIYSQFRRLLTLEARRAADSQMVTRMRILDDAFVGILDALDLIEQKSAFRKKGDEALFNYLPGYNAVGLSGQWSLFGSYKYWFNATYFHYYREGFTAEAVDIEKIIYAFFSTIGFTDEKKLATIVADYKTIFNRYMDSRSSVLLQIFISPHVIDEVAYVAETGGAPLLLPMGNNAELTSKPSQILPKLVEDPLKFEEMLKTNVSNFKYQGGKDREEFSLKKPGLAFINSVEARFFMKPTAMDNPESVQIFRHYKHAPRKGFDDELSRRVATHVADWAALNAKLGAAMTQHKPQLLRLRDLVLGTAEPQIFTLADLLSAGRFDDAFVRFIKHPDEVNLRVDDEGHTLLYQLLDDNKFTAALWLISRGASVNAKNKYGQAMITEFLARDKLEAAVVLANNKAWKAYEVEDAVFNFLNDKTSKAVRLIKHGIGNDVERNNLLGRVLIAAAVKNRRTVVDAILEKANEMGKINRILNYKNPHGLSPLMLAIDKGNLDIARTLIDAGADVNARDKDGWPVILFALQADHLDIAKRLIDAGANLRMTTSHSESQPLIVDLLNKGKQHAVSFLVREHLKGNVDFNVDKDITDPLREIHARGFTQQRFDKATSNALLSTENRSNKNGRLWRAFAEPNWRDAAEAVLIKNPHRNLVVNQKTEGTAKLALYSLLEKENFDGAAWLMTNGANVDGMQVISADNLQAKQRLPILLDILLWDTKYIADMRKAVALLIKNGADPNVNYEEDTVLRPILHHLISEDGLAESTKLLLQNGANPNITVDGVPILFKKLQQWSATGRRMYGELLVNAGADVNIAFGENGKRRTMLYEALNRITDLQAAQWLIDHGADVNQKNEENDYPILLDVLTSFKAETRLRFAQFLVDNQANVNATYESDGQFFPILHQLLGKTDREKEINFLIDNGANVDARVGTEQQTLLLAKALEMSQDYIERYGALLLKRGADVNARTKHGATVTTVLLQHKQFDAAKFMLANGGTLDEKALDRAAKNGKTVREVIIESKDPLLLKLLETTTTTD